MKQLLLVLLKEEYLVKVIIFFHEKKDSEKLTFTLYTIGDIKVSLPIKTDTNLHLHQERSQPDPIMLLAAAAAVIDDEGKYKGRSYERREIRLYGRHGKNRQKYLYGNN